MNRDQHPEIEQYLDALRSGDRGAAATVARSALDSGLSGETVISEVLAVAQAAIGLGWQENRWTVAAEHRATAITESVLQDVVSRAMTVPGMPDEGSLGRTLVLCPEGEWHTLPGRMAAAVLRLRGVEVSFVGPSLPASQIPALLADEGAGAVALTCSLPSSLVGAWRTITELRAFGTHVVCGGRGFGTDASWALTLGADRWMPTFSGGADVLIEMLQEPPPLPRMPTALGRAAEEVALVGRRQVAIVEAATEAALLHWPALRTNDDAVSATRDDLASTLRILTAATLVHDPQLVTSHVVWFEDVIAARRLPLAFVSASFALLLEALPEEAEATRSLAQVGLDACTQPPFAPMS